MEQIFNSQSKALVWVSVISIAAFFVRNMVIGDTNYNFLLWNLFLGLVPLLFAICIKYFAAKLSALLFWFGCGMWLLFYPNAPYMISDFIHVNQQESYVLYDALMIFNIAMLSVFYGLYSLSIIHTVITARYNSRLANLVIIASIVLAAFGVYLGRVLRLNSWDLFTKPGATIEMIFGHLFPFSANPQTWALVIIFSFLQLFLIVLIYGLNTNSSGLRS